MKENYLFQLPNNNDGNWDNSTKTESAACKGLSMVQYAVCLTLVTTKSSRTDIVDKYWLLLDLCSIVSCVQNEVILKKVQDCVPGQEACVYSIGSHHDYKK